MNLRQFTTMLGEKGLLKRVSRCASTKYEIPTIMKMMDGIPLLFENVEGHEMPVVAHICSTRELVALGLAVLLDGRRLQTCSHRPALRLHG